MDAGRLHVLVDARKRCQQSVASSETETQLLQFLSHDESKLSGEQFMTRAHTTIGGASGDVTGGWQSALSRAAGSLPP